MNVNISPILDELSILYIEDNPGDQLLVKELLSMAPAFNFSLEAAASVEEARALLKSKPADILLLDLGLDETQGRDTIDAALAGLPPLPILVLTHDNALDINYYASSQGVMGYLVKGEDYATERLVRSVLMSKVRWDVEREKINLIEEHLRESIDKMENSRLLLKDAQNILKNQVYIFSHQIRGPLCTIEGLMHLMDMDDISEEMKARLLDFLRITYAQLKAEVDTIIEKMEFQVSQQIDKNLS